MRRRPPRHADGGSRSRQRCRRPLARTLPVGAAPLSGDGLEVPHRESGQQRLEALLHRHALVAGVGDDPAALDVLALGYDVVDHVGMTVAEVRAHRVQVGVHERRQEGVAGPCWHQGRPGTPETVSSTAPETSSTTPSTVSVTVVVGSDVLAGAVASGVLGAIFCTVSESDGACTPVEPVEPEPDVPPPEPEPEPPVTSRTTSRTFGSVPVVPVFVVTAPVVSSTAPTVLSTAPARSPPPEPPPDVEPEPEEPEPPPGPEDAV